MKTKITYIALATLCFVTNLMSQEFPPTVTMITPKLIREGDSANLKAHINDPDSKEFTFEWRLPDGSVSSLTQPEFTASSPGANYVQLVVTDAEGNKSFPFSQVIGVHNRPPQVKNISPGIGLEGQTLTFSSDVAYLGASYLNKYSWTLPDGSTSSDLNPKYRFGKAGEYEVKLKVEEQLLEVIYSNNRQYGEYPAFYPVPEEYGDEIFFGGKSRFLQRFEFVYYGHMDDLSEEDRAKAQAVVRFYKNDGPPWQNVKKTNMPQTLIYTSEPFKVFQGYNWKTLNNLALKVPERMTWTVEFQNLPQLYGKQAGLVFYNSDPKTNYDVGESYDDFWSRKTEGSWQPMRMGGKPVANFGMQAQGVSDTILEGSKEFVAKVVIENKPPEILAFNVSAKGEVNKSMTFSAAAKDAGDTQLNYEWDLGDGTLLTGKSVEHTYKAKAKYQVVLTVTDESGASVTRSASIKVWNERIYYEFTSVPVVKVRPGQVYEYAISTRSLLPPVPGDLLKINITGSVLPDWLKVEGNDQKGSAVLKGTPSLDDLGSHPVELALSDGNLGSRQNFVVQVVDDGNNPPVLSELIDREILNLWPDETLGVFAAFDRDPGDQVSLSFESSNHSLMPPDQIYIKKFGNAWRISGTPLPGKVGKTTITVIASDGELTTKQSCLITVDGPKLFVVNLEETSGGSIQITPGTDDFLEDQLVEVFAKPDRGFLFEKWRGDSDTKEAYFSFNITKDTTLGASFSNPKPSIVSLNMPSKVFRDNSASFGTVVEDANDDALTVTWNFGDGNTGTGRSVKHKYQSDGTYTVALTVTDSVGQSDTRTGTIQVTVDRKELRFTGEFDLFGFEKEPFSAEVQTITPGVGQLLDLAVLKKPEWLSFKDNENGTGSFFGNPTTADVGNYEVVVELTDGKTRVTQNYTIEVIDFPEKPVIAAIEDQSTVNFRELGPIIVEASDPDEGDVLEFNVASSDQSIVSNNKMRFELTDDGQRHLYIVPNSDAAGSTNIRVQVSDGDNSVDGIFTLTTRMPKEFKLNLAQAEGGSISVSPEGSQFVEDSVVTVNALPGKGFIFQEWSGDLSGSESPASLLMDSEKSVQAKFFNPVPKIVSINLPTKALAKKPATFNATVTDIDDEDLSLSWNLGDGATKSGNTIEHTYQSSGEYKVTLTVTDSNGASASADALLEVDDDFAVLQFASAPVVEVLEGASYDYSVATVKPGTGQVLELEAKVKPDWISFKDNGDGTATLNGNPLNDQVGIHPVELILSDQRGSLSQSFSVEVINVNQPPTVSAIADAVIRRDTSLGPITFTVSDPDKGDQIRATATSSNQGLLPSSMISVSEGDAEWALTAIPVDNAIGETTITVTVSDGTVEVTEQMLLTVEPPPIHNFTLTQTNGGTLRVEPEGTEFEEGTYVRLVAEPSTGYEFINWTGDSDSPENPLVISIEKPTSIGGVFDDVQPPSIDITSATGPVIDSVYNITGSIYDNDSLTSYQWFRGDKLEGSLNLDGNGNFRVNGIELSEGKNRFKITAKDAAGNESSNEFVVNWSAKTILTVIDGKNTIEGSTISFPVMLKSEGEVGGLTFELAYNPTFLGDPVFEWSSFFGLSINSVNTETPGEVVGTFAFPGQAAPKGVQEVGTLKLRVRSMPFGMETLIEPEIREVSDALGDPLDGGVNTQIGSAKISPRKIKGDMNGNQRFDVGDASLIQELIVKGIEPLRSWDLSINDLNNNNKLDSGDVIRILRVVVGFEKQPNSNKNNDINKMSHWDLTHQNVRKIVKAGPEDGPRAIITPTDLTELTPGQTLEVTVNIEGVEDNFRGASFDLHFPEELMIPQNGLFSYSPGEIVPQSAIKVWNPSQEEKGFISFAASQEEPWPLKNGAVSKFTFVVRDLIAPQGSWSLAVTNLEISYDGYENKVFDTSFGQLNTGDFRKKAEFAKFGFQNGDLAVVVNGTGGNMLVEFTNDFTEWSPLVTIPSTEGIIQFNDPTSLDEIKRFYRLKTFVRPASPPKWIFETGLGRDIGGNNILPPNIVGPINPGQ